MSSEGAALTDVLICGSGVAASCCEHLLNQFGFRAARMRPDRVGLPVVMLSDPTVNLIRDTFDRRELMRDVTRIQKRVVMWGNEAEPVALEHSAIAVPEQALLDAIQPAPRPMRPYRESAAWTIFASSPLPAEVKPQPFGTRRATARPVELKETVDRAACWIESLEIGWLFLIPGRERTGWLLSIGGPAESLIETSRLVAHQIVGLSSACAAFPAYPRIVSPLCGSGWLACGAAAMAFDPLCGDGVGNAIREAILCAVVVRAAARGEPCDDLFAHYRARLIAAFRRHLEICERFYRSGGQSQWWQTELAALRQGIEWCSRALAMHREFRYRLNGFDLEPI